MVLLFLLTVLSVTALWDRQVLRSANSRRRGWLCWGVLSVQQSINTAGLGGSNVSTVYTLWGIYFLKKKKKEINSDWHQTCAPVYSVLLESQSQGFTKSFWTRSFALNVFLVQVDCSYESNAATVKEILIWTADSPLSSVSVFTSHIQPFEVKENLYKDRLGLCGCIDQACSSLE